MILETAVQDGKVMQDFELESLTTGGDHSQKVKAPPSVSDYGSKDCVNLPSSTAVSRMTSTLDAYRELLVLAKQHLLQEYSLTDRILSEGETYTYFASYAQQQRRMKQGEQKKEQSEQDLKPGKGQNGQTEQRKNQDGQATPEGKNIDSGHRHGLGPSNPIFPTPIVSPPYQPVRPTLPSAPHEPVPPVLNKDPTPKLPPSAPTSPSPHPVPSKGRFQLEFPPAVQPVHFGEVRKIIQEKLPRISLVDHLPDDTEARKQARRWELSNQTPQVWILSLNDSPKHLAFLTNIEKTLVVYGIHAQIGNAMKLEQGDKWEELLRSPELQLLMISGTGFHQLARLKAHYQEDATKGMHYLDGRPLLLLSDLALYFKEPSLKSTLWSTLKQLLPITFPRP